MDGFYRDASVFFQIFLPEHIAHCLKNMRTEKEMWECALPLKYARRKGTRRGIWWTGEGLQWYTVAAKIRGRPANGIILPAASEALFLEHAQKSI